MQISLVEIIRSADVTHVNAYLQQKDMITENEMTFAEDVSFFLG